MDYFFLTNHVSHKVLFKKGSKFKYVSTVKITLILWWKARRSFVENILAKLKIEDKRVKLKKRYELTGFFNLFEITI